MTKRSTTIFPPSASDIFKTPNKNTSKKVVISATIPISVSTNEIQEKFSNTALTSIMTPKSFLKISTKPPRTGAVGNTPSSLSTRRNLKTMQLATSNAIISQTTCIPTILTKTITATNTITKTITTSTAAQTITLKSTSNVPAVSTAAQATTPTNKTTTAKVVKNTKTDPETLSMTTRTNGKTLSISPTTPVPPAANTRTVVRTITNTQPNSTTVLENSKTPAKFSVTADTSLIPPKHSMQISIKAPTTVPTAIALSTQTTKIYPKTTKFTTSRKIAYPTTCIGALLMKTITTTTTLCKTITITNPLKTKTTTPKITRSVPVTSSITRAIMPYVSKTTQNLATVTPTYRTNPLRKTKIAGKILSSSPTGTKSCFSATRNVSITTNTFYRTVKEDPETISTKHSTKIFPPAISDVFKTPSKVTSKTATIDPAIPIYVSTYGVLVPISTTALTPVIHPKLSLKNSIETGKTIAVGITSSPLSERRDLKTTQFPISNKIASAASCIPAILMETITATKTITKTILISRTAKSTPLKTTTNVPETKTKLQTAAPTNKTTTAKVVKNTKTGPETPSTATRTIGKTLSLSPTTIVPSAATTRTSVRTTTNIPPNSTIVSRNSKPHVKFPVTVATSLIPSKHFMKISIENPTAITPSQTAIIQSKTNQFDASNKITSATTCIGALLMKTITTTTTLCKTIAVTNPLTTKATTPKTSRSIPVTFSTTLAITPYVSKTSQNFVTVIPTYPTTPLGNTRTTGKNLPGSPTATKSCFATRATAAITTNTFSRTMKQDPESNSTKRPTTIILPAISDIYKTPNKNTSNTGVIGPAVPISVSTYDILAKFSIATLTSIITPKTFIKISTKSPRTDAVAITPSSLKANRNLKTMQLATSNTIASLTTCIPTILMKTTTATNTITKTITISATTKTAKLKSITNVPGISTTAQTTNKTTTAKVAKNTKTVLTTCSTATKTLEKTLSIIPVTPVALITKSAVKATRNTRPNTTTFLENSKTHVKFSGAADTSLIPPKHSMEISIKTPTKVPIAITTTSQTTRIYPKTTKFTTSREIAYPATCIGALLMKTITTTTTLCKTITITNPLTTKATTPKTTRSVTVNSSTTRTITPHVSKTTQNFATATPTYPKTPVQSTETNGKSLSSSPTATKFWFATRRTATTTTNTFSRTIKEDPETTFTKRFTTIFPPAISDIYKIHSKVTSTTGIIDPALPISVSTYGILVKFATTALTSSMTLKSSMKISTKSPRTDAVGILPSSLSGRRDLKTTQLATSNTIAFPVTCIPTILMKTITATNTITKTITISTTTKTTTLKSTANVPAISTTAQTTTPTNKTSIAKVAKNTKVEPATTSTATRTIGKTLSIRTTATASSIATTRTPVKTTTNSLRSSTTV